MNNRLSHYAPALFLYMVGLFFLMLPALAVILVVGGFFTFATIYALIVFKFHKLEDQAVKMQFDTDASQFRPTQGPLTFRQVSEQIFKRRF
jgi:hypothetical protein